MTRICYAYELDAADPDVQSGRPAAILAQLAGAYDVIQTFPLDLGLRWLYAPYRAASRLMGKTYRPDREPMLLRALARQIECRLQRDPVDLVLSPGSTVVTELRTDVPIVFCADATFAGMLGFYESFSNCSRRYLRLGHRQERRVLQRCAAAIYPSAWAAASAIENYAVDPQKVHVINSGANVSAIDAKAVQTAIRQRQHSAVRLLFVGREWHRKRAEFVIDTAQELRVRGHDVEVDLVGLPSLPRPVPAFVTHHGSLSRKVPAQCGLLHELFLRASFLFVPSRAETYGMTFCEAAAYGLPAITTAIGGIPDVVRHDVTGVLLPVEAGYGDYVNAIEAILEPPGCYEAMALAARNEYEQRLNWDVFGQRLRAVLEAVVESARATGRCRS